MTSSYTGSPKNDLLEIATKYFSLTLPEYTHFSYGPPHNAVFLCFCTFLTEITSSQGRTKKEAEMTCSQDMLNIFKDRFFDYQRHVWIPHEKREPIAVEFIKHIENLNNRSNLDVLCLFGNAVLRSYIANYIFHKYSQLQEDVLTQITSKAMDKETRADVVKILNLNRYINPEAGSGRLAEFFDTIVGAFAIQDREGLCEKFLCLAYQKFIEQTVKIIFERHLLNPDQIPATLYIQTKINNYKGDLFEYAQQNGSLPPRYTPMERTGLDHGFLFAVCCALNFNETIGTGKTVKSAEQEASKKMLEILHNSNVNATRTISHSSYYENTPDSQHQSLDEAEKYTLGQRIGWENIGSFKYLSEALTHPSKNQKINYQRLEFLGDTLLRETLLLHILQAYPSINSKSEIAEKVSLIVSAPIQAKIAKQLNIGEYIFTDTTLTENILSDVLEALIATIFLDKRITRAFANGIIITWFKDILNEFFIKPESGTSSTITNHVKTHQNHDTELDVPNNIIETLVTSTGETRKLTYAEVVQKVTVNKIHNNLLQSNRNKNIPPNINDPREFPPLKRIRLFQKNN